MNEIEDLPLVPNTAEPYLNERQKLDYEQHQYEFADWMLTLGKNPERADGYSFIVVKNSLYRTNRFFMWVWDQEGGYTTKVTRDHADQYTRELVRNSFKDGSNANMQKAIKRLFKWRHHEHGEDLWKPDITFSHETALEPRDFLTVEERKKIREAALEYGSVPSSTTLNAKERDRWKTYLTERFGKPKSEITKEDWKRANSWKIPSLVWVSLDTGLRPIEVERATVGWVDTENGVLRIPREESSKNKGNWTVGLTDRTAKALERWLEEREVRDLYKDTDALWLTRENNPYRPHALRYLLHRLCEIAGIATENRRMSWYAIRHSVGTYMTKERDLSAARAQLRHKSEKTTMRYDQVPVEDRKEALDRMG